VKIVISIADEIYARGDRLARQMGLSRNELYSRALAEFLLTYEQHAITAELDEIYRAEDSSMDPALEKMQQEVIEDEGW
jgi:predicted transcriptional regulator